MKISKSKQDALKSEQNTSEMKLNISKNNSLNFRVLHLFLHHLTRLLKQVVFPHLKLITGEIGRKVPKKPVVANLDMLVMVENNQFPTLLLYISKRRNVHVVAPSWINLSKVLKKAVPSLKSQFQNLVFSKLFIKDIGAKSAKSWFVEKFHGYHQTKSLGLP